MTDRLFSNEQYLKVKRLCRECANYENGICILLSDREQDDIPCVQIISLHVWCNYFKKAVLPLDPVLMADVLNDRSGLKQCSVCGKEYAAKSNRSKYCPECSIKIRKKKEAERIQKLRYQRTHLEP